MILLGRRGNTERERVILSPSRGRNWFSVTLLSTLGFLQNMGDETYWVYRKGELAAGNNMADFDLCQ